jgi:hypothetical protein
MCKHVQGLPEIDCQDCSPPKRWRHIQLRKQSFAAMHAGVPVEDLPVVFEGTREQVIDFAVGDGYQMVPSGKCSLLGCYFYNRQQAICLIPTN